MNSDPAASGRKLMPQLIGTVIPMLMRSLTHLLQGVSGQQTDLPFANILQRGRMSGPDLKLEHLSCLGVRRDDLVTLPIPTDIIDLTLGRPC